MQFKSKKPKPPTGMEMTITFFLPADQSPEEAGQALVKFCEVMTNASAELQAAWIKVSCAGIPGELEDRLQAAFDQMNRQPRLTLIVGGAEAEKGARG